MVFKRVLKGIGRLMLTTAVMCGVGLFLCSSEVKAATVTLSGSGDISATVNVTDDEMNSMTDRIKIQLMNGTNVLYEKIVDKIDFTSNTNNCNISATDFIKGSETYKDNWDAVMQNNAPATITIDGVRLLKEDNSELSVTCTTTAETNQIYKVSAEKPSPEVYGKVSFTPNYIYEVGINNENRQYGYNNETFTIKHDGSDCAKYYMLVKEDSGSISFKSSDPNWKVGNVEVISGTIGTGTNKYKVAYLPKVKGDLIVKSSSRPGSNLSPEGLDIVSNSVDGDTTLTYEIGSFENESENGNKGDILGYYAKAADGMTAVDMDVTDIQSTAIDTFEVKMKLNNISTSGSARIKLAIKLGTKEVASVELPITLSAVTANGFELQNVPVSLMAGVSRDVPIIKGILPAGANQTLSNYEGIVTETTSPKLLLNGTTLKYDKATGIVTLEAASGVTSGTATVQIELKEGSKLLDKKSFEVKIISFSKDNTIKSINNSNKNYITYNKDKGYSLDIEQLIIDNAKDTSDNAVTITKDQITDVYVGGSLCTDGIWKPSEAATNKEVKCKVNGVQIDGIRVSAYPMPTATYSSSNRTLSVKIPTKVATAYSDDNNIRQSKGFKLILEDSSGNTLYEYTDSKYQSVLSSSSESTVTYTVPAADIEGMVTSAASNGKFSADTTSVKFKVIPMGYKQSSTSDETIKAKDEIAGKTDAVTVYKVSASGTNFTSSAAYGLDGQTVSITATPNSGYSFKQWSDGNTSNPRQVKVSASGTRAFQAVAGDRVANSTGAGGTDNSELYDDVPKTAESNSAIWLIVFMVFAVMGTTYALYLQLRAANSKHDR